VSDPSRVLELVEAFHQEVTTRLAALASTARAGGFDDGIELLRDAIDKGGVVHAFGTGHSEAFAMEIAGRAGGLIPTNKIALRDVVVRGSRSAASLGGPSLERDASVVDELFQLMTIGPEDVFVIASNSGVNGSVVGFALRAKESGHKVIAVTSMSHSRQVEPKHPSGRRLYEVADVVIDNLAPLGDAVLDLGGPAPVGAVSSITAAFIAQLLTIGTASRIAESGGTPPLYVSANVPGGDEHNAALEGLYEGRIRRDT
jgi:uncharacterized phosphosugar-binding protein